MTCRRGLCSLSRNRSVRDAQPRVMRGVVRRVQHVETCFSETRNGKKSRICNGQGRAFAGCDYWSSELHWLIRYKIVGSALKNRCWNTCLFWLLPYIQSYSLSWRETQFLPPGIGEWGQESGAGGPASSCWWKHELSWKADPVDLLFAAKEFPSCVSTHTHTHTHTHTLTHMSTERALSF